jgi:hypothetical protein
MRNFYKRSSFLLLLFFVLVHFKSQGQVLNWPEADQFGILAGDKINATDPVQVIGSVGSLSSIDSNIQATRDFLDNGNGNVGGAMNILQDNINYCNSLSGTAINNSLIGQVLTAGVYEINSSAVLANGATLELQGDSTSVFIFNINGDLTLESLSGIIIGDVKPGNIYWNVHGKIFIQSSAMVSGVFMSDASISKTGIHFGKAALFALQEMEINLGTAFGIGHNKFYSISELLKIPGPPAQYIPCIPPAPLNYSTLTESPNLILNGSFETMFDCPAGSETILENSSDVCFWRTPLRNPANLPWGPGTPDYFNRCNPSTTDVGVPHNWAVGHQFPHISGNAYAGFYAFSRVDGFNVLEDHREYLRQLLPSDRVLKPNKRYYGEYYVSLNEMSQLGISTLGMAVTNVAPAFISTYAIDDPNNPAQIQYAGNPITDTTGWTRVSGAFQATGGESFITIGNLNSAAKTNWGPAGGTSTGRSYYYIDNIALYELPDAGGDIMLSACNTVTSFNLGRGLPLPAIVNPTYEWTADTEPGFTANTLKIMVSPVRPTVYTLTIKAHGQNISVTSVRISGVIALGAPKQITTINAGLIRFGGTVNFTGDYHVLGPLALVNGEFNAEPGTVFEVEPEDGVGAALLNIYQFPEYLNQNNGQTYPTIIKVGTGAKLFLRGATLTTSLCTKREKWGGLHLADGGQIFTTNGPDPKNSAASLKTTISEAYVAVGSSQLSGGTSVLNNNRYKFQSTLFKNNKFGFRDYRKGTVSTTSITEGIESCTFEDNNVGVFFEDDKRAGIPFGGNYANALYADNKFLNNNVGVQGVANNIQLIKSEFTNNTDVAVHVDADIAGNPAYRVTIDQNTFNVPDNAKGIWANNGNIISANTIEGRNPGGVSTGISTNGSEAISIEKENMFKNLQTAIYAGNAAYEGLKVKNNTFEDNLIGIHFPVLAYTTTAPTITCNTFTAPGYLGKTPVARGIFIDQGARLTDYGNPNEIGNGFVPNGNRFEFLDEPIRNDGVESLDYYSYNSTQENWGGVIFGSGDPLQINLSLSPSGACGSFSDPGVFARQSNAVAKINGSPKNHFETELLAQSIPNPTQGMATVSYNLPISSGRAAIVVNDIITKREVKRFILNPVNRQGTQQMNLENLQNGVYTYSLLINDLPLATRKLIIWK